MSKEQFGFDSPDHLAAFLKMIGVPVEFYGQGSAKEVADLWHEINKGDCVLVQEGGEVLRVVQNANLRIYYLDGSTRLYLKEDIQIFSSGRSRRRDWMEWSVSEKLEPGESPLAAAYRGLAEELSLAGDFFIESAEKTEVEAESESYPGINTRYQNNFFEVYLSDEQFNPEGYQEVQEEKTTYWVWEEAN